ncbi:acyl-CoA synthetase [Mycolicibacterium mageritense DSM 44476 = CIP 104973]|uniref:Long-chain-fatty-acid--CoA ligase FadD13 n=1 Tax=Mycolicibacterium mageritense TaxID=53462 RepID=A0AAI8XNN1_MYCME|nr:long-chain-fatty-acid--CoA ligase FadD2 [Mycolicibacterium mageritense]OKH80487.1 acyl-CoA synthetase [Mycobacterium sp. SWH-M3]TXI66045.1 MAG: acyl-CoA synthetase [Mycolicibacterium mageritense]CDO23232.1 acyl-CoA synthetase [Mycolicibacterium mageritense DSM 44476 = CIP 104973]BBX32225.1 acyl-CoA synthetase [Mycolicibacterium mageritense]BDY29095.1 Long-chain-fatty-acid--CoA ligase [Mycolicibacterium mageritense]
MPSLSDLPDLPAQVAAKAQQYLDRGAAELHYARKMFEAGALKLESPQHMAAMLADIRRWGELGMIPALNARRHPNRTAVIDDDGEMTFGELDAAAHATANGLLALGVRGGDGVAILARNHRWFLVSVYGAARAGARIILLNSEFSGPQIKEVAEREGAKVIIYDDEYAAAVSQAEPELGKLRALGKNPDKDEPSGSTDETLADLIARSSGQPAPKATKHSSIIILTSGTTGTPKGANRGTPPSLAPIGGVLSHVPFRAREVTSLPAPMFHALGFLHGTIAMMLGSTLVLRRRFKPATVLEDIEKHKVTAMVVVPVMLSRILDTLDQTVPKPNLSSLRIVFVSGSQLGAELATRALKDLGPVIYNLYGSTEIAFATIARPKDLSINPATVGPVVKGVRVKIIDDNGNEVPQGEVGRIFVGNTFPFEGYTGGGGKQIIDGLLSSGDVGYFDEHGLLYVSGRDDEMIVSGGENVFPAEVEDLISGHPEVIEATALGVEDKEWGARLRAFVVKAEGASVDEDDIKKYVKDHLARYKVPREVIFLDELPRNPTGKILKRELRDIEVE